MAYESESGGKKGDEKVMEEARKYLRQCIDDEAPERAKMLDDLKFCTLDQWPEDIRRERENDTENGPRPCLTIDKINQYIVQVVNDMRQGKPGINVRPQDDDADIETAKILKGLVRNIEDQSNADIAYATAGESAAKIGLGYFRITTEYVSEDSFDQDIFIKPLPNTFAVYLGPHIMPDGSDAKHGFIVESLPIERFREEYPKAKYKEEEFDDLGQHFSYWHTGDTVTVVEYFCIERTAMTLYFLADGTTISKADYDKWPVDVAGAKPTVRDQRTTMREQLKWCKMTGVEVLEKRDLPGKYIPIVEVIGRESHVEGKRHLWGLVRPAKDSLRMYNYFASTITEKMGLAPKAPFIGAVGQFATAGDRWRKANRVNYAVLEYDPIDISGNAVPAPQRQGATPLEAALLNQMQVIEHDVQTSLGMFKAAVGETESQQSGRAILALQRESDTGTYHFGANLGVSIRHAGRIIVDMIPHYYDTRRIVRILGEDGEVQAVQLDPTQETAKREVAGPNGAMQAIYNPGVGKYDVTTTVGPSYNTKRMEAAATFVEMAKGSADPASAAVLRYLVMRNSDSAGADEAAKLLKSLLPPQTLQAMESKEPIPPQVQAQMAQMQAQGAQMQEGLQKLAQENMQLKAGTQADMAKIAATREAKMAELKMEREVQDERNRLAREQAQAEIDLAELKAAAELRLEKMRIDATANGEVDAAIAKVSSLATIHQTKVQAIFDKESAAREASAEGEEKAQAASDSTAQVQALQHQFTAAIEEIVKGLTAKKTVQMTMPDGRHASAQVTVQ
jgi:hypothetical protein